MAPLSAQHVQVNVSLDHPEGWAMRGAMRAAPAAGEESSLAEALSSYTAPAFPMTFFSGEPELGQHSLRWTAGTPRQAFRVYVQRSTDALHWAEIGMVVGEASTQPLEDWTFADSHPLPGANYYRLRQVTADGNSVTSDVMVIESCPGGYHITYLYPHPGLFGTLIQLELSEPQRVEIRLLDEAQSQVGILFHELAVSGHQEIDVDLTSLPLGRYTCEIVVGDTLSTRIIQR